MSSVQPFGEYLIEHLAPGEDPPNHGQILDDMRCRFEVSHITYYWARPPRGPKTDDVLITTYPEEWVGRYFSNDYSSHDPVLRLGKRSRLPFDWDGLRNTSSMAETLFDEAEDFGVGNSGVSVPVWGFDGEGALFSVTAKRRRGDWLAFLDTYLSDLLRTALLFHDSVMSCRPQQTERGFLPLSKREIEVLEWAARGKTAWETGQILGLSEKTVYFYLRNAAAKLGVASKTQAVAQAAAGDVIRL
jgi:DNA-binding CsgD family transcriptional regulator